MILTIFIVLYCIVGFIVGTFMFGVSSAGAKPTGIELVGGIVLYYVIGALWLPLLCVIILWNVFG